MARRTFIIRLAFHYTIPIYNKYTKSQIFTQNGPKNHKKSNKRILLKHTNIPQTHFLSNFRHYILQHNPYRQVTTCKQLNQYLPKLQQNNAIK